MNLLLVLVALTFQVKAADTPNDAGGSVTLSWKAEGLSPDHYKVLILRGESPEGPMDTVKTVSLAQGSFVDVGLTDGQDYYYRLVVLDPEGKPLAEQLAGPVRSSPQWFHTGRLNILIGVLIYLAILLSFIFTARRGRQLYLRPIPGLSAVDEAVGRATEMGKPILYVPGLSTIDDVATIASLNILSHVTKKAAEYETPIIVPNRNPVVYTVAQEVMREAYYSVGRPDLFDPDNVFFVTDSQFGYAAAVSGIMVREKPATNFFMGMFWAESLILAETGASTGAVQIAGTDAINQLPFFITACDYTLIGEELYAASAYLSREPVLTATLKGQDWMKVLIAATLILASILGLMGKTWIMAIFK